MMISAKSLSAHRGGQTIWAGVSFKLAKGEALRILGENGAGKSTLLMALSGALAVDGQLEMPKDQAMLLGHQDGLKAQLTGRENLSFWAELYGQPIDLTLAKKLGVSEVLDRAVSTYSAGQRRKLALSKFAQAPGAIWLMDEPMTNLDKQSKKHVTTVMQDFLSKGGAILFSSHTDIKLSPLRTLDLDSCKPDNAGDDDPFLAVSEL